MMQYSSESQDGRRVVDGYDTGDGWTVSNDAAPWLQGRFSRIEGIHTRLPDLKFAMHG